jgi:hypothetical protein
MAQQKFSPERHDRAASADISLIVELVDTADMPDGREVPPHINDDVVWHVVDRADALTRWRRISLAENPRPDCRQVTGAFNAWRRK